jgi:hypothetical protein
MVETYFVMTSKKEILSVTSEIFRRFVFRQYETTEEYVRKWIDKQKIHNGDCTKEAHTCPLCLLANIEDDIVEQWNSMVHEVELNDGSRRDDE